MKIYRENNKTVNMQKINQFFINHGTKLIVLLLVLVYFKSCSVDSDVSKMKKNEAVIESKIDSLPSNKDLKIEGLKSEKRMIQATNRKMLDVQRENEIEVELKKLDK